MYTVPSTVSDSCDSWCWDSRNDQPSDADPHIGGMLQPRNLSEDGIGGQDHRPLRMHLMDENAVIRMLSGSYATHRGDIVLDVRIAIRHIWREYADLYDALI